MLKAYEIKTKDLLVTLDSAENGLSAKEALLRLEKYGLNKLPERKPKSRWQIFLSQFQSPLIYILLAAAGIVLLFKEAADASIIFLVLLFNAIVGTFQEGKAQNILRALKKFVETKAVALRDNHEIIIPDTELVAGDVVVLEEGDRVPADLRIIKSNSLRVDEAALTGESEPVYKSPDSIQARNLPVADQKNMVFKSTYVVSGNGSGIVVATGINTEIGKVSQKLADEKDGSPLKSDIEFLSKLIIWAVTIISGLLFLIGLAQGKSIKDMFAVVVALSVSIIPEGLPIVTTLVLATGVWRMTKKNALVKKLQAVESLGQAKVIALDKTGTITKNEMVVRKIYVSRQIFEVTGEGYIPQGKIYLSKTEISPSQTGISFFLKLSVLSSNARIAYSQQQKIWVAIGDPTQAAMVCLGEKFGFSKDELETTNPRVEELPFDYRQKYHVVVNKVGGKKVSILASAPEVLINASDKIFTGDRVEKLEEKDKAELTDMFEEMSSQGLRIIGLGYKEFSPRSKINSVKDYTFMGFVGIEDTVRPEVKEALRQARAAGIKVIMVTGDNKITAKSIGSQVGIYKSGDAILTGSDIDGVSDEALAGKVADVSVFARVTPDHKLRIINAYKNRKEIIAMTGDGVNDAPSLMAADLGVAMGKIGTEVAKEASDIVLLDDNFGSIVSAIDEGRSIYKTIKKVILYLFSTSFGEVFTIAVALVLGYPLPILASQIIWLNFVTDGFLVVSLAMDPKEKGLLDGKFFEPKKYLVDLAMARRMLVMAIPMSLGSLVIFKMNYELDMVKAWTLTLTVLAVFQWLNAWNCRSESKSVFKELGSNKYLIISTFIVVALQLLAVYHPLMQKYLRTTGLSLGEWALIILLASSIILIEEARKFFSRSRVNT